MRTELLLLFGVLVGLPSVALAAEPSAPATVVLAPAQVEGELPELDREAIERALRRGLAAPELALVDATCTRTPCTEDVAHPDAHRVELHVVAGARTYEVELRAYRPDRPDAYATAAGRCEICGLAELEQLVLARADTLRQRLTEAVAPAGATTPVALATPPAPRATANDTGPRRPPSTRRVLGGVSLGVGLATLVAGAVLVGIDGREIRSRCDDPGQRDVDGDCRWMHKTLGGGIAMTLVGTTLAATGVALLVTDRRRGQRHDLRAMVGPRRVGLALSF